MIRWLITLPVVAQITLLCAVIAAVTSIITTLVRERPKLVPAFIALIVVAGLIGFFTLPTPSKRIRERIERGEPFRVVLYKRFGDLAAHQVYSASYAPSLQEITVTGLNAGTNQPFFKNKYPCKDIDKGYFNLWGHVFSVDDYGSVVDRSEGRSGTIYFDKDVN